MLDNIFFWIYGLILIIFSIMTIFSTKILSAIIYSAVIFFVTSLLYFNLNFPLIGCFQILLGAIIGILIFYCYINTKSLEEKISFKPIDCLKYLILAGILFCIGMLIYYFNLPTSEENINFISNKTNFLPIESTYTIVRNICENHLVSFVLVTIILFISIIGISILLVKKNKEVEKK